MEGGEAWLEKGGRKRVPFLKVKGAQELTLTVILRPLLVEDGVCRQFEAPPLAAALAPPACHRGVGEVGWGAGGHESWESHGGWLGWVGKRRWLAGWRGWEALSLTDSVRMHAGIGALGGWVL